MPSAGDAGGRADLDRGAEDEGFGGGVAAGAESDGGLVLPRVSWAGISRLALRQCMLEMHVNFCIKLYWVPHQQVRLVQPLLNGADGGRSEFLRT
jgi:hypothetical protein